ncbi:response regulator [Desulfotomaculum copahuensis]|uniref:Stage 0 sporulation protein A homolog n=2 Tax=Desulfotomaculum copahuensis TaxID=1838280 RepID=A0A1B7LEP0_9FIRM|nr:response regulator [Desulfotomaculum copahuensis]
MTRILVIDDDADIRYTIGEICAFAGWQAVTAANGREGVRIFRREQPDLVIVDYHMPVMDGLATLEQIRRLDPLVPLVVLTVDEQQAVADMLMAAGATDFALKPIKAPDLICRLKVNLKIGALQKKVPAEDVFIAKGISNTTMQVIIDFLTQQQEALSIEQITGGVGLAYQTVHRYLAYMENAGLVTVECNYGRVGRPRNFYRLAPGGKQT